ncbi:MAG: hypothetical protein F4Y24_06145 [Gemmatimonadetes bacterium]|nr:hypothetical protein [Gemmatimonadota bacterium]MYG23508.1 hypothetical protein [Gemmatimonadota bacterium]MYJ39082.1 hypothetical protein [Gemmatimonadota bacterium]
MRRLSLLHNQLAGPIPPELGSLGNLEYLGLHANRLTGPIPPELGSLANLDELDLSVNALTGPIPPSLLRLDELRSFLIEGNALCVPGTSVFGAWLRAIENHDAATTAFCNAADLAALRSLYEAAGGTGWIQSGGWPDEGFVEDWHGVSADSLGRVTELDLAGNGLQGQLPPDLGTLVRMTGLRIGDNALSGRLPLSLARLSLTELHYAGTRLCAPAEASFRTWLNAIRSHDGTGIECALLSDSDILALLYEATGGPDWFNNRNWLTGAPLAQWYGVRVGDEGRVVGLISRSNNLTGPVPAELGNLDSLRELDLGSNQLTGPIPAELGNLGNLEELSLSRNNLTGPIPAELGNLDSLTELSLASNQLTGPIPTELGNLANLTRLWLFGNELTGPVPAELGNLGKVRYLVLDSNGLTGPIPAELGNLANLTGLWLFGNELIGPIPPELGGLGNLTWLDLTANGLTGPIPAELGNLGSLEALSLSYNSLTGPIPPELGNLANLRRLDLSPNAFTGPIPAELGNLVNLEELDLGGHDLTGPIPPELGRLSNVKRMLLWGNHLTGPIPPELGGLGSVTYLALEGNALSGSLPPELGNLAAVEELFLEDNKLEGPVPSGLGGMASLRRLGLTNNAGMEGPLPADMTGLHRLEALLAGGTDLCAPSDAGFQGWLNGVHKRRIRSCVEGDPPMAYLTQAVQSRDYPVPLVAAEEALLRVFVTARNAASAGIPAVRARFYVNGRETHVVDIPVTSTPIPTAVDEGSLSKSINAEIPADVIQPGLEMVIEVDPEGTLDESLGVETRIPQTGRLAVDVRAMPLFELTLIPFVWTQTNDQSIVDLVEAMAADPENHDMLGDTRTLLPVGTLDVKAHEPVLSSSNHAFRILHETEAIRAMEGGSGHYMGMMAGRVEGPGGVAAIRGWTGFSIPRASTIAHELGHNLSLRHAPCGRPGALDLSYPYSDGFIGAWGYDFRNGGSLVRPTRPDLMSYCEPEWISDYSFTNALRYRLFNEGRPAAAQSRSLLLWGGIGTDSVPFLEPAFVVDAPALLPDSAGDYRLTGRSDSGVELFSLAFAMPETADGDGSSSFAFVLPARAGWDGNLASITLTGPGESTTLDGDSDVAMAILRNPRTGQIRGILRDLPAAMQAAADKQAVRAPDLKVLFSRGIPGPEAWKR